MVLVTDIVGKLVFIVRIPGGATVGDEVFIRIVSITVGALVKLAVDKLLIVGAMVNDSPPPGVVDGAVVTFDVLAIVGATGPLEILAMVGVNVAFDMLLIGAGAVVFAIIATVGANEPIVDGVTVIFDTLGPNVTLAAAGLCVGVKVAFDMLAISVGAVVFAIATTVGDNVPTADGVTVILDIGLVGANVTFGAVGFCVTMGLSVTFGAVGLCVTFVTVGLSVTFSAEGLSVALVEGPRLGEFEMVGLAVEFERVGPRVIFAAVGDDVSFIVGDIVGATVAPGTVGRSVSCSVDDMLVGAVVPTFPFGFVGPNDPLNPVGDIVVALLVGFAVNVV